MARFAHFDTKRTHNRLKNTKNGQKWRKKGLGFPNP